MAADAPSAASTASEAEGLAISSTSMAALADVMSDAVADAPEPDAITRLESLMASVSAQPLYRGNRVELLVDGPATYEAMLDAIGSATHHVHLETYIFNDDNVGRRFADALIERSKAGVEVRIIYDSFGSRTASDEFFERMQDGNIELISFHPVNPLDGGNPLDLNVRDHRKILVVDGTIAFTGGINIDRNYSSSSGLVRRTSRRQGWRDTHIAVTGPGVEGFQRLFLHNWMEQEGTLPAAVGEYLPALEPEGEHLVRVLSATGGDGEMSAIRVAYGLALQLATERIWITQSYFGPDADFLTLMKDAAGRGVDVRIAVAGVSDAPLLLALSRFYYGDLLRAGIHIYESTDSVLHAKTAVVDRVWSTVGSSNLDYRSFLHNHEVNAVIVGREFSRQLEELFEKDTERSREVMLEEWKKRPLTERFHEWLGWLLRYWL